MAERFGMTDFVNPSEVEGDLVPYLVNLTKGGADYTFDATGNVQVMRAALESAHKGWGESIIIGVAQQVRKFQPVRSNWSQVVCGVGRRLAGRVGARMSPKLLIGTWKVRSKSIR